MTAVNDMWPKVSLQKVSLTAVNDRKKCHWLDVYYPEIVHTLSLSDWVMLLRPVWCDPLHVKLVDVVLLLMMVFRISFTTAWQELGYSSVGKVFKLFKRSTIGSVIPLIIMTQCALNKGRQYGLTNKMKYCGFSSNWILPYYPTVCSCVRHRRDISHFSHI